MATCQHTTIREIATTCYRGSVSADENRAAHGCICVHEECVVCGARRYTNVNGRHVEEGPWGESRVERRQLAAQLALAAQKAIDAAPPMRSSLGVSVRLDASAHIVSDEADFDVDRLPAAWLDAAKRARLAVLAAADARANV